YPVALLKPVAGPYFFELLTGRANRPIRWVSNAAKRAAAPSTGPTQIALRIRTVELSQLGQTEHPIGSNSGWPVTMYQRATGAVGLAWCVSFQQWAFGG